MCDFNKIKTNNFVAANQKDSPIKPVSFTLKNGQPATLLPNTYNNLYKEVEKTLVLSLPRKIKA